MIIEVSFTLSQKKTHFIMIFQFKFNQNIKIIVKF